MQIPQPVTDEVNRIVSIHWARDQSHSRIGAQLVREFLRRSALWAMAHGATFEWAFCDVAEQLHIELPYFDNVEQRIRESLSHSQIASSEVLRVCLLHIKWTAAEAIGLIEGNRVANPYELLIRLFELGMTFEIEKGFISVCGIGGIPIARPENHYSLQPVVT